MHHFWYKQCTLFSKYEIWLIRKTNLYYKSFYLHLIKTQLHKSIHIFPLSYCKFDCNLHCWIHRRDALKGKSLVREISRESSIIIVIRMYVCKKYLTHLWYSFSHRFLIQIHLRKHIGTCGVFSCYITGRNHLDFLYHRDVLEM